MASYVQLKKTWPGLRDCWAQPDVRDEVIDYVGYRADRTGIKATKMVDGKLRLESFGGDEVFVGFSSADAAE